MAGSSYGLRVLSGATISAYEESPKYNEGFFRNEYGKFQPFLNLVSNPLGLRSGLDEARRAAREEFARFRLAEAQYTPQQIEEMNISGMSAEEADRRVRNKKTATDGGTGQRER